MTVDPVIAARFDDAAGPWAGVWIADEIELIARGVHDGTWIDGELARPRAGLGGLDDPASTPGPADALRRCGAPWLAAEVAPLSEAMHRLTGDPVQIAAHARAWRHTASALRRELNALTTAVRRDTRAWTGGASAAYRRWAGEREQALAALARAAETMAAITEGTGALIGTVRAMMRDAVTAVVSRLLTYAVEPTATAGAAAVVAAERATALCAATAATMSRWLTALFASIRRLLGAGGRLADLIRLLKEKLVAGRNNALDDPEEPAQPTKDPELEAARIHGLGMDPHTAQFRPTEAETARRLERERGITLTRAPSSSRADWFDETDRSYDAVGPFDPKYFERQWRRFSEQIVLHLKKADLVPVDVSQFTPQQVARIEAFIARTNLAPRVFIVGR
ncbi:WXG100 family type VII secretion target [Mangrovihabitans endophyticus]|uniref:CdiA C-terminal tRNase domain-containing protein n=1 Tax=Mangrovihabitans endophyticus TaxID=1751298 RepID=A0A8J3BY27_9ACTN|nr:WXG100 family type VII secretion target [Mangrovihabitans endophyticus]GGK87025.1 hypothetical protein GCM10012284_21420 [Mangrovihabitans endophyticus]